MHDLSDHYRKKGYWRDRLLTDFLRQAVRQSPQKLAVKDDRFGSLNYQQLASQSWLLASALRASGITRGDKYIVALPNWQQVPVFVLALNYLGAIGVHMPITGGEHEFAGVLAVSKAQGIVVPEVFRNKDFVALIDRVAEKKTSLTLRVVVGSKRHNPGWLTLDELLARGSAKQAEPEAQPTAEDLTCLLFTSGSSGTPKGVMHSSNSIGAMNTTVAPIYDLGADDIIFMGAPLGFSAGYVHGLRLAIYLGATLILQEAWDADRALETMVREKATFTLTTPTMLKDLFDSERFAQLSAQLSLRLMFCGGACVPFELLQQAHKKLPGTFTSVLWGMTEGIGTACRPGTPLNRVATTDGQAFLGTELKILGLNQEQLPPGEEGDLVMRGPQQCLGYFENPQLDRETFLKDKWFRTGDLAVMDAEGYVKITGRRKELIIRGGANISPLEIEQALFGEPGIGQLAIVGIPDKRLGERICACVVADPGGENPTLADLVAITRRKGLAKNKWPEHLQIIEALPMTSAGKLRRSVLQAEVIRKIADASLS